MIQTRNIFKGETKTFVFVQHVSTVTSQSPSRPVEAGGGALSQIPTNVALAGSCPL
jgi:hypothetical protein